MTTFGWDMSHYDAPSIGNAIDQGVSFVTHKAGGDQDDAELGSWWAGICGHRDRVLAGAYWVLLPGSPQARADAFLARLDATCPGWRDGPFILQVDCEKWNNDSSTMPGKSDIKSFCDRLVSKVPTLRPIVYAPKWAYGDSLANLGYPLWASSYVTGSGSPAALYPGDNSSRWVAYSGQTPAILQFTSSASIGGQTTCDANAFRGTLADLVALVAPGWGAEMEPKDVWNADVIPVQGRKATWVAGATLGVTYDAAIGAQSAAEHAAEVADKLAARPELDEAALAAAVAGQVLAGLKGRTAEETAAALRVVLGDQAAEVGALLAAKP